MWSLMRNHRGVASKLSPPVAKKIPHEIHFGVNPLNPSEVRGEKPMNPPKVSIDPYFWLRDDTRSKEEVLSHLNAENAYCEQEMDKLKDLQNELYTEILSHLQETDEDVPHKRGKYMYYSRTETGLAYKIRCRRLDGVEQVVLDENEVGKGHEYSVVSSVEPSPDHSLVAYAVDNNGYETYTLKIKDIETNTHLADEIEEISGDITWGADKSTFFYLKMDAEHRPCEVWMHVLGTPAADDLLVHSEANQMFWMGIGKTQSNRFLIIQSGSKETDECHIIDLHGIVGGEAHKKAIRNKKCVREREFGVRYEVEHHMNKLYITTNKDGCKNNKLVCTDVDSVLRNTKILWVDVKPYDKNVQIEGVLPFQKHLVIFGREAGFEQVWIADADKSKIGEWKRCPWPEEVYSVWAGENYEFDTTSLRLGYSSLITPKQVLEMDLLSGEVKILKQQPVPGYQKENYDCCRIEATASDGKTKIPISMVYKKDNDPRARGPCPTLLYGYGSYGACMDPTFDFKRSALLDRGIIYAIAHIRGGGEMGRPWYEDEGKYLTKKNTFTDFGDCAKHLISNKMTSTNQLATIGRSAGGLLMGGITNMYSDLFKAIIADVPFVDLMNTMCDPTIPLTVTEWEEWGNPNEEKYFDYMMSYSPYDNVVEKKYPAMLVTAGLNDPRVAFWEPAKWVAKIRELKKNPEDTPLYLKTDMSAGHFSASDRYKYIKETAFEYSFIIDQIVNTKK